MHCDPERIAALLSGEIEAEEQHRLEAHIETCDLCRNTLSDSASELGEWSAAASHLRDDEYDGSVSVVSPRGTNLSQSEIEHAVEIRSTDSATAVVIRQIVGWLDPTDDPRMLGRLGGYEIAGVIGSGGMGVVLKGFDASLNRFVAIKLLAPHLAGNGASRQRFAREAQAAAAVVHENVIAIHSVSEFNDLPYLVMPYVRGMSLQKRLDSEGPLELEEILRIGMQTASGLAQAHALGLVHRDIKPANILLADGVARVTITDFGLARAADDASLTHSGMIAGTPQYMSPEQASGSSVDQRSDLYSLGSLMYAMCAGRPPFRADSAYGILKRIAEESARPIREVNPKVPEWLANIIGKLHQRDPGHRFRNATDVERLLADCLAHVQQPTRVGLPPELNRLGKLKRDSRRVLLALGLIAIAVGLGFGGWFMQTGQDSDASMTEESPDETVATDSSAEAFGRSGPDNPTAPMAPAFAPPGSSGFDGSRVVKATEPTAEQFGQELRQLDETIERLSIEIDEATPDMTVDSDFFDPNQLPEIEGPNNNE